MDDADRVKLLFGPYRAPRCRIGKRMTCEVRGEVTVHRMSDGRIPWPIGKTLRALAPIVCGDLAKAVRKESNQAVCYWWGVTPQTVTKWRKAIGVGIVNDGTHRLRSEYALEPDIAAARVKGQTEQGMLDRRKRLSKMLAHLRRETEAAEPAEAKAAMQRAIRELEAAREAVRAELRRMRSGDR